MATATQTLKKHGPVSLGRSPKSSAPEPNILVIFGAMATWPGGSCFPRFIT